MTFFWDTHWCFAAGIVAATLGSSLKIEQSRKLIYSFVAGLLFIILLMYGSIWLFIEVDADWMLNYFFKAGPNSLGWLVIYPITYTAGFVITMELCRANLDRWWMLIFSIWWVIFTIIMIPRFYLVYGTTSNPEWFWEVSRTTDNLVFIPIPEMSLGILFMFFFIASFVLHAFTIFLGIMFAAAKKDCNVSKLAKDKPYCCIDQKCSLK